MRLLPRVNIQADSTQFIYALFVIILVPVALVLNTLYLLRSFQRDIDFELNNKALLVTSLVDIQNSDKLENSESLKNTIVAITKKLPEIKAIELLQSRDGSLIPFVATTPTTSNYADHVLNDLAWSSNQTYSKQIMAKFSTATERTWLVAATFHDRSEKKIGVINLYLSAKQMDEIVQRTSRDSLIILAGTIVVVLLLLLNHFRFFETALLVKKLRDVDKIKDDFIAMTTHELRTPLTVIADYYYLITKDSTVKENANISRYLTAIKENIERLKILVNDMLDVSRLEQNKMQITLGVHDMRTIVAEIVGEFEANSKEKGLTLSYNEPSESLPIRCDPVRMHQVLANLVGNAIKYTPKGEVSIFFEVKNNNLRTFVKDTGVGMSAEDRERLFSKFYRIYNPKTKDIAGTGLGLWITKQLVERMGGKITVDSIENEGTEFILTFPLQQT